MLSFAIIFLIFSLVQSTITLDKQVLVLDDSNFDEALANNNKLLIEFYAPWCGHCKSLAPEWSKAAVVLKDSPVKLAKVDCTVATATAKRFEIKGFPTIKYFANGNPSEYQGGRTEKDIVAWVNKKSGPATKVISTDDELLALHESHEVFVLGFFDENDSSNDRAFSSFAADSDFDFPFVKTSSQALKSKLELTKDSIIVFKSFDEKRADHFISESFDQAAVMQFIVAESTPLIQEFTKESSQQIFSSVITKHALFFSQGSADEIKTLSNTFQEVAKTLKGRVLFVHVPSNPDNKRVADFFGIASYPFFVLADMNPEAGGMKKYQYSGSFEVEPIISFFADYFDGKIAPSLKSEEPSPEDTAGDVVVLKGKSFAELVVNNDKDVFVEFYAPWCGHCKQLTPTWNSLGKKFKSVENVVIAKMDATANEIDIKGFEAKGFPTLYFVKGNDKTNPIKYEGARELDDLVSFVQANAHNKLSHDEL